jgi:hypothetical protein
MTDERLAELERAASPARGRFPCPQCGVCDLHAGDALDVVAELVAEVRRLRAGLAAGRGPQSVEQMCRGLLEEAEGLASFSGDTPLSAGELTGMANLLTAHLRTAVAAERERCAKAVEVAITCECGPGFCECYGVCTLRQIAAAIRGQP